MSGNKNLCLLPALLFLILLKSPPAHSQPREFSFNSPGNVCYFQYLGFTPDGDYVTVMRPFIFILGKAGQPVSEVFRQDTLKNVPQFSKYYFVYIPNNGGKSTERIGCIPALSSLVTFHYKYGHENLFLQVMDPEITEADLAVQRLPIIFKNIRYYNPPDKPDAEIPSVTESFREDASVYHVEKVKSQEDYATYYYEEDTLADDDDEYTAAVKQYFGPPTTFNFTLTGQVRDRSTGEALPFATVMVKGTSSGTVTNADGCFTLVQVPTDTSVLLAQYVGYATTSFFLTPYTTKKNLLIEIRPSMQTLQTVNIVGEKEELVLANKTDVNTVKMTPKKLENLPSFGEKDIMRSLQLLPGISASNESSSGLYVRGGTPDQNLVLYDGFTVYHVDHLYGFYSAFNTNAVKDVQLYKGSFESRFGGRISSVTEITGKDGNQNKFNAGVDVSLLSVNAFLEVPIGRKFTSVIAFRRSYQGFLYNTIFDKFNKRSTENQPENTGGPGGRQVQNTTVTSYFYDLNGKFTFRPSERDIFSLSIFNSSDKLDNSSAMSAPSFGASGGGFGMNSTDLTKYGNIGASLKWARKKNDKLYRTTLLSYSNYFSDRDRSQDRNTMNTSGDTLNTTRMGMFENNDLRDYTFKTDYQWDLAPSVQLAFGAFGTWFDIKYDYAQTDTSNVLDKDNEALLIGGYFQGKFKLAKDKLQILPGFRFNYFGPTGHFYPEPRLSVNYNLTDRLVVKAGTGLFYQFVNRVTREDIMSGSRDFWLLSNGSSVPVSSAVHFDLGLAYETVDYLFSAEAYYKQIENLTEYSLRFDPSPMGVSVDENFFSGQGFSEGIEFLAQKKAGNLNGWLSYTLGEARNRFDVYTGSYYPANQDVTHEFKAVLMYKLKRWDFSATWIFATGRPYTAPSGAYTITLLDGTTQDFFTVTAKNGVRLPDYNRADISVNYKLLLGNKGERKRRDIGYIGFSIFNLYNRQNVWYKEFVIEDRAIVETNVNYMGITPNIVLSLKFR